VRGNVHIINPEIRELKVPAPLRDLPLFLVWRYEAADREGLKPLKVPYYALGNKRVGRQGSPEDRGKLVTFTVAREQAAKRGMDGVGMALLEGYDILALDFDNCVGPDRVIPADILAVIGNTYAEYSPSGEGIRALYRGNLGNRKSKTTDTQYGMETFSTNGFVTLTGEMLPHVEVLGYEDTLAKVTPALEAFCADRFGSAAPDKPDPEDFMAGYEPKLGLSVEESYDLLQQLDPDMGREDWIRVGMALHHEYDGEEEGFDLWNEWSAYSDKYPGDEGLRTQWDSFTRRVGPGRKQTTMASVKYMVKQSQPVTAEDLMAAAAQAVAMVQHQAFDGKFPVLRQRDLTVTMTAQWLIKSVLPRSKDPIILYGASGAGKSFVALDQALAIARGVDWRGCRVTQGRVLYVAAEGGANVAKRIQAYCDYHGINREDLPLDVIIAAPNLLEQEDVTELTKSLAAFGPYDLVIIDTLAQVTPGANENAGEDMGPVLANIKAIQNATGATVVVVHHAGKDLSRGSRGWSGLKAAAEAQLEVVRDEDSGQRHMRVEKMKDGEDGAKYGFKLEIVQIGVDEDGDAVTSCVVLPVEFVAKPETAKGLKRRGRVETHVLEVIATLDPALQTIRVEELVKMASDLLPPPDEGKRDTRRQHVARAIDNLCKEKDGEISKAGNVIVLYQ